MTNVFTKIFGFIIHAKAKVSEVFVNLFGHQTAVELAHGALAALENTVLGKQIYQYVSEFEQGNLAGLANDVKHVQVVAKVKDFATSHNIPFLGSVVDALISLAVAKLRGYYDAAGAHDPKNPPVEPPATSPAK